MGYSAQWNSEIWKRFGRTSSEKGCLFLSLRNVWAKSILILRRNRVNSHLLPPRLPHAINMSIRIAISKGTAKKQCAFLEAFSTAASQSLTYLHIWENLLARNHPNDIQGAPVKHIDAISYTRATVARNLIQTSVMSKGSTIMLELKAERRAAHLCSTAMLWGVRIIRQANITEYDTPTSVTTVNIHNGINTTWKGRSQDGCILHTPVLKLTKRDCVLGLHRTNVVLKRLPKPESLRWYSRPPKRRLYFRLYHSKSNKRHPEWKGYAKGVSIKCICPRILASCYVSWVEEMSAERMNNKWILWQQWFLNSQIGTHQQTSEH